MDPVGTVTTALVDIAGTEYNTTSTVTADGLLVECHDLPGVAVLVLDKAEGLPAVIAAISAHLKA